MKQSTNKRYVFFTVLALLCVACTPLIGPHSPTAYENATSLKAETLVLLSKANLPYEQHQDEVAEVMLKAEKAYEFVNGVPNNQLSAKQWQILKDPEGDLLGKFFKRWRERGVLSKVLIDEYKNLQQRRLIKLFA